MFNAAIGEIDEIGEIGEIGEIAEITEITEKRFYHKTAFNAMI